MKNLLMNTAAAAALTLVLGGTASAQSSKDERRERVNTATVQLRELQARDSGHIATTELGTAEAWLKEAEASATKRRRRKAFRRHIARVDAMMDLVEALLDQDDAERMALEAEAKADRLETKLRDAMAEAEELETRQAELEKELTQ